MRHPTTPSIAKKTATAAAVSYHVNWYGGGGSGGGEGGGGDGGGGSGGGEGGGGDGGGGDGGGGDGDGGGGDGGGGNGGGGDGGGGDGGGGDGGGVNGGGGDGGGGATTSGTRTPVATLGGVIPKTCTWVPVSSVSRADSVEKSVAARMLAAALAWATAALLGMPGPLSGMVRSMENRTPAACHSRRPATCSRRPDGGRGPQSAQSVPSAHTLLKELVPPSLQTPSFMFNGL